MVKATQHIALNVIDMDKVVPFYEEVLGLKKIADLEMDGHFLDTVQGKKNMKYRIVKLVSPENFMIEILQSLNHQEKPQTGNCLQDAGLRHFAYEVEDVDEAYRFIKEKGYETISEPCTSEDKSMRLFFVYDPEYNLVEIMQLENIKE